MGKFFAFFSCFWADYPRWVDLNRQFRAEFWEGIGKKMRRRAADFRRPVRRRFPSWIWVLLGVFSIAGLFLFVVHHNQNEDRVAQPALVRIEGDHFVFFFFFFFAFFKCFLV